MAFRGPSTYDDDSLASLRGEGREPGTRRKKIAGYLKAANELRQSYVGNWGNRYGENESGDELPGAFPDAAVARNGEEEMLIFPSYARRHVKHKPKAAPGTIQEVSGTGRDSRDTAGAGDAEFWRDQWEKYEDDKAIVDVDVRGWIYTPHKGQMNRKQRLMVALARQLVGIPAPSTARPSPTTSAPGSRSSSPQRRSRKHEEELAAQEAEAIMQKGNAEADIAGRGGFSEQPMNDHDGDNPYSTQSRSSSPFSRSREGSSAESLRRTRTTDSLQTLDEGVSPLQKRSSWPAPANMSAAELAVANSNLMSRLKPFMANPLANTPISAFFYNDKMSRQKTVSTDASGHFSFRASLDFVPTHVRVLGSEKLSVQEEVHVTESSGISLVSDIDDTVRHSAITRGAREIFRNAFIRDLGDLTVDGVKEWYNKLADMGVQLHYVSNSPWQLYPVITSFFALAGLPRGSFHLKQYSGMLQGIFEPVAERKKATLDKIMRDFPERKFILIGDSGEADLEVYTDVVMDHPGRVVGIYIRDVTTPPSKGFFDPSMGPFSGEQGPRRHDRNSSTDSLHKAKNFSRPSDIENDDDELRAAIAASLKDMEEQAAADRRAAFGAEISPTKPSFSHDGTSAPRLPARRPSAPAAPEAHIAGPIMGDLIDLSDDPSPSVTSPGHKVGSATLDLYREASIPSSSVGLSRPARPSKPSRLRSHSNASSTQSHDTGPAKALPPKPRKPSTTVRPVSPSPLSQVERSSPIATRPPPLPQRHTYRGAAKQKLNAAYNALPSASTYFGANSSNANTYPYGVQQTDSEREYSTSTRSLGRIPTDSADEFQSPKASGKAAPPPPPRRAISSYPAAAAHYASNRISGNWGGPEGNGEGTPQQPLNKKEELWKRRFKRAKDILDKEGVILRTWRVGGDVMDECVGTIEKELRNMEAAGNKSASKHARP